MSKEHLDAFSGSLEDFAPKTCNHYRAAVRQFLQWSARKDDLPATHRLFEADTMRPERANTGETQCYTPGEFAVLLEKADATLRPITPFSLSPREARAGREPERGEALSGSPSPRSSPRSFSARRGRRSAGRNLWMSVKT